MQTLLEQYSFALFSLPFITALIGWVTNYIAIKMLFHPREPFTVFGYTVQGILPRRQPDIATQLGVIVASDLLSSNDLTNQLTNNESRLIYEDFIDSHTEKFIREKLGKAVPVSNFLLRSRTLTKLKTTFADELLIQLPELVDRLTQSNSGALDVKSLVEERVKGFSTDRLEKMLYDILAKEFRFIEFLGALLGFIIGLLQLLFISLTS